VDAAVATGFALAVVHPAAGNIGGGGFMLLRQANGDFTSLTTAKRRPGRESRYVSGRPGNVIPKASLIGYKAIGVPGS